MRVPEANYMEHVSISFKAVKGKTHYYIRQWDANGLNQQIIKSGIVKDFEIDTSEEKHPRYRGLSQ